MWKIYVCQALVLEQQQKSSVLEQTYLFYDCLMSIHVYEHFVSLKTQHGLFELIFYVNKNQIEYLSYYYFYAC
jgi:hypothetical protein